LFSGGFRIINNFGEEEAINLLRDILLEEDCKKVKEDLTCKVEKFFKFHKNKLWALF